MDDSAVTCIGAATWDTIARVDRLPGPDDRIEALALSEGCGGPAATAAVTLRRLGVPVSFVGILGQDDAGDAVMQTLTREGVDTTRTVVSPRVKTARSLVLVSGDARAIVTRTTARTTERADVAGLAPRIPSSAWYHVDQVGWQMLPASLARGAKLSVDDGNAIESIQLQDIELYGPTRARLLQRYPGLHEEAAVRAAARDGARMVVMTAGTAGALVYDGTALAHIPAVAVPVVSTLGAGDVFHGAVLAGLLHGMNLGQAAALAAEASALSCTALDGQSAIPRRADLAALVARTTRHTI